MAVDLGTINAKSLTTAGGIFSTDGPVTIEAVTTTDPLTIKTTGAASNIIVNGSATSTGGLVDIEAAAAAVTLGGAASGGAGNVTVLAGGGTATVIGKVASAADYLVTGQDVLLGSATATGPAAQTATGKAVIRSTGGGSSTGMISAPVGTPPAAGNPANVVTLTSGTGPVILDSFDAIVAPGLNLVAGTTALPTDAGIRLNDLTKAIVLGDVTARQFGSVDYVIAMTPASGYAAVQAALATQGNITLGKVTTVSDLTVTSTPPVATLGTFIKAGLATSKGAITFTANGTLQTLDLAGAKSGATAPARTASGIALTSDGDLTATATLDSGQDISVTSIHGNATVDTATTRFVQPDSSILRGDIKVTSAADITHTATLGSGTAGKDIVVDGGNVVVTSLASADDDVVLVARNGSVLASANLRARAAYDDEVPQRICDDGGPAISGRIEYRHQRADQCDDNRHCQRRARFPRDCRRGDYARQRHRHPRADAGRRA